MSLAIESPLQKNNFISNEAVAYALNIQRGILPKKKTSEKNISRFWNYLETTLCFIRRFLLGF